MNLLIIGCGAMGASLAQQMTELGHDVSVVDRSAESFSALPDDFGGFMLCGNPIDQDVLRRAGIEGCDAVAAMTPSDNVNVMVSQLARELFGVKKVLTRISYPAREMIFAQLGLHTICPTALTVDSAVEALTDCEELRYASLGGQELGVWATVTV